MGKQNQFLMLRLKAQDQEIALGLLLGVGLHTLVEKPVLGTKNNQINYEIEIPAKRSAEKILQAIDRKESSLGLKLFEQKKIIAIKNNHWKTKYEKFLKPFFLPTPKKGYPYSPIKIDPYPKNLLQKTKNCIQLRAQTAFGTGSHASTQLAALLLQEILWKQKGSTVLDFGTGSGILAMVAKLCDATRVWAVENDPEALEVAKKNFIENNLQVKSTLRLKKKNKRFNIIVANILAPTLIELKGVFDNFLELKGYLILSGLTYSDTKIIKKGFQDWKFIKRVNQKGWSAWLFQKNSTT